MGHPSHFFRIFLLVFLAAALPVWLQARNGDPVVPVVQSGQVVRFSAFYSKFVAARNIDVWLPPGYDARRRYPVLYMHDGQMLFDSSQTWNRQEWGVDETAGRLIGEGKTQPFLVVGIWNSGRTRYGEYFPEKPFSMMSTAAQDRVREVSNAGRYAPLPDQKPFSDAYLRFVVTELKPFIDKNFSTRTGRDHTWMAGSSMGGLISWYGLCEYPGVFGRIACLSTHWPGIFFMEGNTVPEGFFAYLEKNLPRPGRHRMYFDIGDRTLDSLYPPLQARFEGLLRSRSLVPPRVQCRVFPGQPHSEKAWAARLGEVLLFLAGNQKP